MLPKSHDLVTTVACRDSSGHNIARVLVRTIDNLAGNRKERTY